MPPLRILWKLYAGFVLVIAVSALGVLLLATPRVEAHARSQVIRTLEVRTALVAELARGILLGSPGGLTERLRDLGTASGTRFTVIRQDGTVLADTLEEPARMENHRSRPEVVEAELTGVIGRATRYSRTIRSDMEFVARTVDSAESRLGYIRAAIPLTEVEERRDNLRSSVGLGSAIAAGVALLLGFAMARQYVRPLVRMTGAAERIARGDYDQPVPARSRDEIGQLGRAIRRMADQLRDRMEALVRERNELRAILASMLEGVIAVDGEERVVHMNGIAAQILGTKPEAATGRRIWEISRVPALPETIAAVLRDATEHTREFRITEARRERSFELRASPLKDLHDEIIGVVLVLHDATELRRLETVRRDFVANVSHELKTPLTAIRGFVETLLDDPEVDEETKIRFLTRTRDQVLRLSALVADLLVLSRVESEEEALERNPLDLRAPLADSARRLAPEAARKGLDFRVELPEEPVPITGDEEALRQVVDNLLDNAMKYTPGEGRVRLRLTTSEGQAVLTVEDSGIGIEAAHLNRIFERFYRVDKARSRELGGTGLGLSIVKHIVSAHGGRLAVTSSPGRGTLFQISFPLRETT